MTKIKEIIRFHSNTNEDVNLRRPFIINIKKRRTLCVLKEQNIVHADFVFMFAFIQCERGVTQGYTISHMGLSSIPDR